MVIIIITVFVDESLDKQVVCGRFLLRSVRILRILLGLTLPLSFLIFDNNIWNNLNILKCLFDDIKLDRLSLTCFVTKLSEDGVDKSRRHSSSHSNCCSTSCVDSSCLYFLSFFSCFMHFLLVKMIDI